MKSKESEGKQGKVKESKYQARKVGSRSLSGNTCR